MGSEYFINSQELQDKVRDLLPSQGGAGAGFDLSASTQIIPIIDLTESAEGSNLRQDLQTSISFGTATAFSVADATTTVINNTGYWRILGTCSYRSGNTAAVLGEIILNDGTTDKTIWGYQQNSTSTVTGADSETLDFTVFLEAGHSLIVKSSQNSLFLNGSVRQVADINGKLVDP